MASEKAKALAAEQKAQVKAEKLRKKNSTDPKDWGQWKQFIETYKVTAQVDTKLPAIIAGAFFGPLLLGILVAALTGTWWLWPWLGLMIGMSLAMWLFLRRVKAATYKKYEGQVGSAEVALRMLPTKEWASTPAVGFNRDMDVVHRALGPAGIVLVGEGDPGRLRALMATEVKKHEQVAYGIKVIPLQVGKREGQIPLDKLADHIKKLPKTLDKVKQEDVAKRLRALDVMRSKLPIPKGPMPTRGGRSSMRGR
ncbi:MAG TPA: DUF4191 domain-containing protein [Propionibacteriaceae bacterium]|nr:DUF4191 domain-containing protein [Propionibacteriaceae bacterium]